MQFRGFFAEGGTSVADRKGKPAKAPAKMAGHEGEVEVQATRAHEKLRARMDARNLNITDLLRMAAPYGMTAAFGTVKNWLNGGEQPRFRDMVALSRALELPLDYLADDSKDNPDLFRSDLDPSEQRVLEITRRLGSEPVRLMMENVSRLGLDEANNRLMLMVPMPILGQGPPTPYVPPSQGRTDDRTEGEHIAAGSKVNPVPRRK